MGGMLREAMGVVRRQTRGVVLEAVEGSEGKEGTDEAVAGHGGNSEEEERKRRRVADSKERKARVEAVQEGWSGSGVDRSRVSMCAQTRNASPFSTMSTLPH